MAPRTHVARGEICFVEEAPGKARGGGTARVVRSHVARFRHRRQRDADVRAFQESRDGAREGGGSGEDADESETTDEELSTLEIATRSEEELVRPPIEPCLAYQDNCELNSVLNHILLRPKLTLSSSDPLHISGCRRACSDAPA